MNAFVAVVILSLILLVNALEYVGSSSDLKNNGARLLTVDPATFATKLGFRSRPSDAEIASLKESSDIVTKSAKTGFVSHLTPKKAFLYVPDMNDQQKVRRMESELLHDKVTAFLTEYPQFGVDKAQDQLRFKSRQDLPVVVRATLFLFRLFFFFRFHAVSLGGHKQQHLSPTIESF
jgi:hypothetical protein